MSLLDRFPHTCQINRMTYQRTPGRMGNVEIPSVVYGGDPENPLRCWVMNASSSSWSSVIEWAKRDVIISHVVNFREKLAIELGDEILIDGGPAFVGDLLSVRTHPVERTAGFAIVYSVYCEIER